MTIPYNVTLFQLIEYLKDNFLLRIKGIDREWLYLKDNHDIKIKRQDIPILCKALYAVLDMNFPKLKLLLNYLNSIAPAACSRGAKLQIEIPALPTSG